MSESINEKTYALFANSINRKLVAALENTGAKVLRFPPVEIEKIVLDEAAVRNLQNLMNFDWLIFPDVLTVEFFLENLEENKIDSYEMDLLRVCAFGETVSDSLRFASLHADVVPPSIKIENVYAAIVDYTGEKNINKLKFLYPKEQTVENDLSENLREKGATVVEMPMYRAVIKNKTEITKLKTLLKGGAIDEFIISSPTDWIALSHYFAGEKLTDVFTDVKVSAADRVLLQSLAEYDFYAAGLFQIEKLDKVER